MQTKSEKPKKNATVSQKKTDGLGISGFEDNRSEAVIQQKIQEVANKSEVVQKTASHSFVTSAVSTPCFTDNRPESIIQKKAQEAANNSEIVQKTKNATGMPDNLKSGVENMSGIDMSDVKVHYNSPKPAQLQAHAYTQGSNIHVAPGQEKHLPHEAWHVVQQKQGRVKPTLQMKTGVNINDDKGLEKEADMMGNKAMVNHNIKELKQKKVQAQITAPLVQRKISFAIGGQVTFTDIDHLKKSLKAIYGEAHHKEIDTLVDNAEKMSGRAIGAVDVFNQIRGIAGTRGWTRVVVAMPSGKHHGPVLPVMDAHETKEDKEYAMSTFMFSTVTLARASLTLPNKTIVPFEARNDTSTGEHAEDVLIGRIGSYLTTHRIDARRCGLRITINNAPCGDVKGEQNCAGKLNRFKREWNFSHFRVYFMKSYGKDMPGSVSHMRSSGIKVGSFAPRDMRLERKEYSKETWAKIKSRERFVPDDYPLDDLSDSESESESESPRSRRRSRSPSPDKSKRRKKSRSRSRSRSRRRRGRGKR